MNTWQFTILLFLFIGILILLAKVVLRWDLAKTFNIAAIATRVRIILKSFRFVPITVITTNEKGEIVVTSPRIFKDFGWTEDELLGKTLAVIIPEDHLKAFEKFKILEQGSITSHSIDIEGVKKNGETLPIEATVISWEDEDYFKTSFHTISLKNIQHRKDNQAAAIQIAKHDIEKLELSAMGMGLLNAGAWKWDLIDDIVSGDYMYIKIFSLKLGETLKAKDVMEMVYFEDRNKVEIAMQVGFEGKKRYDVKYRVPKKDGSKNLIYCVGMPKVNKNNIVIGIEGIVQILEENVD